MKHSKHSVNSIDSSYTKVIKLLYIIIGISLLIVILQLSNLIKDENAKATPTEEDKVTITTLTKLRDYALYSFFFLLLLLTLSYILPHYFGYSYNILIIKLIAFLFLMYIVLDYSDMSTKLNSVSSLSNLTRFLTLLALVTLLCLLFFYLFYNPQVDQHIQKAVEYRPKFISKIKKRVRPLLYNFDF